MIITQTPVRISFLGGGSDYPAYYLEHGGATLATSINHYNLITVHPLTRFAEHCARVHYSRVEAVGSIDEIQHPSARECLRFLGIQEGIEIHYVSDLPARTGLGSSSAATVGLLTALHAYKGEKVSQEQVAAEAVHVEQQLIGERVGSQDQYSCALGGLRYFEFLPGGVVRPALCEVSPERREALSRRLLLFYTGVQRHAHEVLEEQIARTQAGDNTGGLHQLKALAHQGVQVLCSDAELTEFGALLHEGWMLKRRLSSKISNSWLDDLYDRARRAGAVGGKLLGAGGGGFLLIYSEPENQDEVCRALAELKKTPFAFDNTGSQVIFSRRA